MTEEQAGFTFYLMEEVEVSLYKRNVLCESYSWINTIKGKHYF